MFWNKLLFSSNIVEVFLTIDGIYYFGTMGFKNPLWNMIEISLPKLKLIIGNYETRKKHKIDPK